MVGSCINYVNSFANYGHYRMQNILNYELSTAMIISFENVFKFECECECDIECNQMTK